MADQHLLNDIRAHGPQAAIAAWREHHRTMHGPDLSYADLAGLDLKGCNLAQANLSHARLMIANLIGTNLQGAVLHHANLNGAQLQDANLDYAQVHDADFIDANLQRAKIWNAHFERCRLIRTNLSGARLNFSSFIETTFGAAVLNGTDFRCAAKLLKNTFIGAQFKNVDLRGIRNLERADLAAELLKATEHTGVTTRMDLKRLVPGLRHSRTRGKIEGAGAPKKTMRGYR
ncbi:MAG: pentapeptide repeat-containing protein [Patescibacteria group bacterium]